MSGSGGNGFGAFLQNAISQLPYNMQNYVGGPSYTGMSNSRDTQPGGQMASQSAYTSGPYNQLTNDMRHGNMGASNFYGGRFGYSPYSRQFVDPYAGQPWAGNQPWMGGQAQPWSQGGVWQSQPQQTQPFYGGQPRALPYAPMDRSASSAMYARRVM